MGSVYVMVVVPAATPDTTPVDEPTVATLEVLLLHVPPPASVNVIAAATQTLVAPVMADGSGSTVTTRVVLQPVPSV